MTLYESNLITNSSFNKLNNKLHNSLEGFQKVKEVNKLTIEYLLKKRKDIIESKMTKERYQSANNRYSKFIRIVKMRQIITELTITKSNEKEKA